MRRAAGQPRARHRRARALRRRRRGRRRRRPRAQARIGAARHGASLQGLHGLQSLPLRLVAAVPGSAGHGLRQQRAWRPRPLSEGAGLHAGAAARRAVLRDRRGDLLRHRHRLRRAAPDEHFGQRHDRDLRPGAGRPLGDAARAARWARASSRSMSAPSGSTRAKEFGADEIIDPRSNDPVGAIKDLTHGTAPISRSTLRAQPEARIAAVRAPRSGARRALSASATMSRSTSAPTCCASS